MISKRELDERIRENAKKVEAVLQHGDARVREKAQKLKKHFDESFEKVKREGNFKGQTLEELKEMMEEDNTLVRFKADEKTRNEAFANEVEEWALTAGLKVKEIDKKTAATLAPISEYFDLLVLKEVLNIIEKGLYKKEERKREPEVKIEPEIRREPEINREREFKVEKEGKREPIRKGGPGGPMVEEAPESPKPASSKRERTEVKESKREKPALSVDVSDLSEERKVSKETKSPTSNELLERSTQRFIAEADEREKKRAKEAGMSVEDYRRKFLEDMERRAEEQARRMGKTVEEMQRDFIQKQEEYIAKRAAEAHLTPEQFLLERQKSNERRIIAREREREHKEPKDKSPKTPKGKG